MSRRLLPTLLVALALLAGCATVPGNSDVTVLRRIGDAAEPTAPPGPVRGAGPLETVRGWVLASGATTERHQAARAFLTSAAAGTWDDGAAPTVVSDQVDTVFAGGTTVGGQATVRLRATTLGVLTPDGAFVARPGPVEFDLALVEQSGQWRISSLPAGTIVRRSDLRANTRPVRTWFLDPQARTPVSDPRYLATSPARSVPARTLQLLLAGPSEGLSGAAISALPRDAVLRSDVEVGSDGTAVVDLARTGPLDELRRREIAQQVTLTLAGAGVPRVRLLADGVPLLAGAPEITVADVLASLPPEVARRPDLPVDPVVGSPGATATPPLVTADGRVRLLSGEPMAGPAGTGSYRALSASPSPDGQDLAVVSGNPEPVLPPAGVVGLGGAGVAGAGLAGAAGSATTAAGARLLVGPIGAEPAPTGIEGRTVARPSWSPAGDELWTVVDGAVVRALRRTVGGATRPAALDATALAGLGPASALRVSPDGARLAVVVGGRVSVAAIARDAVGGARLVAATVVRAESLVQVLDVGWTRTDQLVAVGNRTQAPVALVSVDGLDLDTAPTTNLTPPVTAVAAQPGRSLVVADQSGTWTLPTAGSGGTGGTDVWRAAPGFGTSTVPAYPG